MAITIAFTNQKGGVGKTTSTIEIGACLSRKGYKTLVVDLEQQRDTTRYTGGSELLPGIYDALVGRYAAADIIQQTEEFDLLSGSAALSNLDRELTKPTDVLRLKKVIIGLNELYDFILVDTNPGRNSLLNMAYVAADYIIVPTDIDAASINGIRAVSEDIQEYKEAGWNDADILGVILTRFENTGMHKYAAEQITELVQEIAPDAFFATVRKSIAVTECKAEGSSLQAGKYKTKPAEDYRAITEKILEKIL